MFSNLELVWPWWHVESLGNMLTTKTIETRFHNENVISTLAPFPLPPPNPSSPLSPDFKRAPGWDKLMYLRCGNQILKSLPSPSSPFFPCFSPNPKPPSPLFPALLFSLIEFNSAQGDRVIDRLRETEEFWFNLFSFFFFTVHILCQIFYIFFFFYCALGFAIDSLLKNHHSLSSSSLYTFPPHWTLASHSCLTRCERERKGTEGEMEDRERPPPAGNEDWNAERRRERWSKGRREDIHKRCDNIAGNLMWENKHELSLFGRYLALSLETTYPDYTRSLWVESLKAGKLIISAASRIFSQLQSWLKTKIKKKKIKLFSQRKTGGKKEEKKKQSTSHRVGRCIAPSVSQRSPHVSRFLHGQSWFMKQLSALSPKSTLTQYSRGLSD